jgi:hypothetical protein
VWPPSARFQHRRVGKANGSRERATDGVPTIYSLVRIRMVGTAQVRLCPPYSEIIDRARAGLASVA